MVKMSALRNCPVLCAERRIGFLQSIAVDHRQKRVQSLMMASGMHGKRVVAVGDILSIGDGVIRVRHSQKYTREDEPVPFGFVRDGTGLLVGRITDYMIEERDMRIAALEMIRGYRTSERTPRIWLFTYAMGEKRGEVLVPADIAGTYLR